MRTGATRKRAALILLCAASFMAVVDTTIVSIALPSIRRELGFSGADAQWVLNGYALAFGGLLLLCGRAGDLYGRRRLFAAGLAVFGVASLVRGFAPSPSYLVAARFLQGARGAALVPASLSLLTSVFAEGEERNRAIGVYGATAAVGFVVGMVGGGVITELLGWRWVMFVNVPVAFAALLLAPVVVPESGGVAFARRPRSGDGHAGDGGPDLRRLRDTGGRLGVAHHGRFRDPGRGVTGRIRDGRRPLDGAARAPRPVPGARRGGP